MPRPDKGMPFAEALDETACEHCGALSALDDGLEFQRQMAAARRVMRKDHNVFAALAESERRDREAELGHTHIRNGLAP